MNREFYNSLQEAYQQIEEQGQRNIKRNVGGVNPFKAIGDALKTKPHSGGSRNRFKDRSKPTPQTTKADTPASTPAPAASTPAPKPTPAATPDPKPTTVTRSPGPGPGGSARPATQPTPKPESRAPKPGFGSDGRSLNTPAADRAAKVKASGGDPTAGGEFKTKVTDTGSARLNKALSGIGKWNEETLLQYAQDLVEGNYAPTVEDAMVIIQHLSPEVLDEALS